MTVREIIESVEMEIAAARGQVIRLEDVKRRILLCARAEPSPALPRKRTAREPQVLKLCPETTSKRAA